MEIIESEVERIVRFSGFKFVLFFWPAVILLALSLIINPQGWQNTPEWVYCVLFVAAVVVAYGYFVSPRTFYIRLSSDGFLIHRTTCEFLYRWNEVFNFRIVDGPKNTGIRIVWNLTEDSPHRTKLVRATGAMLGHDGSLLDTFELPAVQLVELLNEWQEQFGNETPK